ncbi:hypothetical protein ACJJTC_015458 [Scirpophaga incertulas]
MAGPSRCPRSRGRCWQRAARRSFFSRDNAENFITFCRELGVHENLLFESDDLVLHHQPRQGGGVPAGAGAAGGAAGRGAARAGAAGDRDRAGGARRPRWPPAPPPARPGRPDWQFRDRSPRPH